MNIGVLYAFVDILTLVTLKTISLSSYIVVHSEITDTSRVYCSCCSLSFYLFWLTHIPTWLRLNHTTLLPRERPDSHWCLFTSYRKLGVWTSYYNANLCYASAAGTEYVQAQGPFICCQCFFYAEYYSYNILYFLKDIESWKIFRLYYLA